MVEPSPPDIDYQLQHIQDDRSKDIIVAIGICLGFAIITVLFRFLARHLNRAPLGGDDWTIVFGLAVIASITFYIVSLAATKISILLLYGRVFPKREFHAVLWGVGIFVAAFTIANVLFVIFSCRPIRAAWNPFVKGKCINTAAAILAVACLTTATDFIILGLPLPLVWRLHLPTIKKVQLTVVFLIGTFASMISIYRATIVAALDDADLSCTFVLPSNLSWTRLTDGLLADQSTNRSIWSGVEICIAIVCANLATLRPLLKYIFTGKALSAARSVTTSRGTTSGTSKRVWQRWTWRHVSGPKQPASKVSNDGTFHRLEHHSDVPSLNDVERPKFEGYMMSPISSPNVPETAHFGGQGEGSRM
ncbi:MAG: hypothetical protein Q9186_001130 [Xanthomendoza sp. 1 TL-2023]